MEEPMTVPVPRPGLLEEYQQYMNAVDEHNRKAMASACGSPQWYIDEAISPARQAPRCEHIRAEGLRCQAPALRGRKLCYAHTRMLAGRRSGLQLPALEDASGIALAAMQVVQQMLDGKLERKTAAIALYGIQIVAGTLKHKPFSPKPTSVVLEAAGLPPEEELLAWAGETETSREAVHVKIQRGDAESRRSAEKESDHPASSRDQHVAPEEGSTDGPIVASPGVPAPGFGVAEPPGDDQALSASQRLRGELFVAAEENTSGLTVPKTETASEAVNSKAPCGDGELQTREDKKSAHPAVGCDQLVTSGDAPAARSPDQQLGRSSPVLRASVVRCSS
jgi:hypothetical protein